MQLNLFLHKNLVMQMVWYHNFHQVKYSKPRLIRIRFDTILSGLGEDPD